MRCIDDPIGNWSLIASSNNPIEEANNSSQFLSLFHLLANPNSCDSEGGLLMIDMLSCEGK